MSDFREIPSIDRVKKFLFAFSKLNIVFLGELIYVKNNLVPNFFFEI